MSGSETPEDLIFDYEMGGGEDEWNMKVMELLKTDEGLERLRTFVRRFKRKGGENGAPGDVDALIKSLMSCLDDSELTEEKVKELLEGEA